MNEASTGARKAAWALGFPIQIGVGGVLGFSGLKRLYRDYTRSIGYMLGICRGNGKENGNYYLGFTGEVYEEYGGHVRRLVGPMVYRGHWHISVS